MSTSPECLRRTSIVGRFVVLLAGVALFGACAGSNGSSTSSPTVSTKPPFGFNNLPPATIPASGCVSASGASAKVTVTVDDRGFSPRCVIVASSQTLELRNTGKVFHDVVVEDLDSNLPAGGTQTWDELGQYLAPGNYLIYSHTERNVALYPTFHTTLVVKD